MTCERSASSHLHPRRRCRALPSPRRRGCSSFVYADILPQTLIDVNSMKGRMAVFDVIAGLIDGCPPISGR